MIGRAKAPGFAEPRPGNLKDLQRKRSSDVTDNRRFIRRGGHPDGLFVLNPIFRWKHSYPFSVSVTPFVIALAIRAARG